MVMPSHMARYRDYNYYSSGVEVHWVCFAEIEKSFGLVLQEESCHVKSLAQRVQFSP